MKSDVRRGSIGWRFYGALFVLTVAAFVAFGFVVAERARGDYSRHSRRIVDESLAEMDALLVHDADVQASLMQRAASHLSDNLSRELEDLPFDVFAGRSDLLVAWIRERLDEARTRNRDNSRVIAGLFREESRARIEGDTAELLRRAHADGEQRSRSVLRELLALGGVFLLGTGLLTGLVFQGLVLRPIRGAVETIERRRQGDRQARMVALGSDEVARLATSYNAMADEIEEQQSGLERTVEEKTASLESSLAEQRATNDRLAAAMVELESTQAKLLEAARMAALGNMARGMAHEFNNIMGGISGCAEDLLVDCRDAGQREVLEVILRTSKRARVVTENLSSFARPGSGERVPTSVHEVLASAVALVQPEAGRRRIALTIAGEPGRSISTDPRRLQQVFLNLILNAVQATSSGGSVRVRHRDLGGSQEITIVDDGVGIDAADLSKVFEPFWTTKDQETSGGGTGLGLAVSRGIVESLGGTIAARSEGRGRGAEFVVILPAGPEDENREARS